MDGYLDVCLYVYPDVLVSDRLDIPLDVSLSGFVDERMSPSAWMSICADIWMPGYTYLPIGVCLDVWISRCLSFHPYVCILSLLILVCPSGYVSVFLDM